ncbi:hypothetical protein Dimus_009085 [Dionaea muscipula]
MGHRGRPPKARVGEKTSRVGVVEELQGIGKGVSGLSDGEESERELRLDVFDGLGSSVKDGGMIGARDPSELGEVCREKMEALRKRRALISAGRGDVGEGAAKGRQGGCESQAVSDDRGGALKLGTEKWVVVRNKGKQGGVRKDVTRMDLCSTSKFDVLNGVVVEDGSVLRVPELGGCGEALSSGKLGEKEGSVITAVVLDQLGGILDPLVSEAHNSQVLECQGLK